MSETNAPEPKKKGKAKLILMIAGAVVVGGGGIAGGLVASGMVGGSKGHVDRPLLVPKEGADVDSSELHAELPEGKSPDATKFKASYLAMDDPFTANLRDSDSVVQLGLGVSTYYDARVLDAVKEHEMAVRSAVLLTLADQDPLEISEPEGKQKLRKTLRKAVNGVLKEREGFGGIDSVYFTSFVIQ
jgi:flagellar protein FliL